MSKIKTTKICLVIWLLILLSGCGYDPNTHLLFDENISLDNHSRYEQNLIHSFDATGFRFFEFDFSDTEESFLQKQSPKYFQHYPRWTNSENWKVTSWKQTPIADTDRTPKKFYEELTQSPKSNENDSFNELRTDVLNALEKEGNYYAYRWHKAPQSSTLLTAKELELWIIDLRNGVIYHFFVGRDD